MIAEFLRTYNDQVDDERRQDLFAYAALVVDTRQNAAAERRRANMCLDWWLAETHPRRRQMRRSLWMLSPKSAARDNEIAHRAARWAAADPSRHAAALQIIEAMAGAMPLVVEAPALVEAPLPMTSDAVRDPVAVADELSPAG